MQQIGEELSFNYLPNSNGLMPLHKSTILLFKGKVNVLNLISIEQLRNS
jgi:hypothetical protein